jgi:predicted CXXCH cytochrome family protein
VQFKPNGNDSVPTGRASPGATTTATGSQRNDEEAVDPQTKSFEIQCAACHYNGYTLTPTVGGEFIAGAVNDPNGEADIDGDGVPNELNLGCESCHGAGSAHVRAAKAQRGSTIVNPGKLAAERAMVICNQCHSRPQGTMKNDQPINKDNRMLTPGISRNEYLVNHTSREDAAQSDFWGDGVHSKAHHQQGTDLVRSKKYINATQTLSCADCHDPHGKTGLKHQVKLEVRDDKNSLCASCHKDVDSKAHTAKSVGFAHEQINCISCHMTKTMQTGAGLGKGLDGKDGKNYWMNDITSHLFDVPRKTNVAVKGVEPKRCRSYTNACGPPSGRQALGTDRVVVVCPQWLPGFIGAAISRLARLMPSRPETPRDVEQAEALRVLVAVCVPRHTELRTVSETSVLRIARPTAQRRLDHVRSPPRLIRCR